MRIAAPVRDQSELHLVESSNETFPSADPLKRWVLAMLASGFLVLCFAQSWGLIEDDTKLPLILSPFKFMVSAFQLWNQDAFAGSVVQTGLVFPMDIFFALTQLLHVPAWCAERIWLALLLTVGCWGVVRLAEALGIGTRGARVFAGLAYCVAPIVVTWSQSSADLLAVVLLPWVLIPLVRGSRGGSPRRAAAQSGVAIALMGGGNAVVILVALPAALIWLLTRRPGPRRRSLLLWWFVAAGMATFWWLIALTLVGKYGFNYLPYTETSITTTQTTSAFESLGGASYWLDYYTLQGPLLPGAWTLVSSSIVILGTSALTALGLAGLCRRIPERLFLVATMSIGATFIAIGYAGSFGGPFSQITQHLLQTRLAPLRNVSKFAPDVALPLVMGMAWTLSLPPWANAKRKMIQKASGWKAKVAPEASTLLVVIRVLAVAALVVAAAPYWQQNIYRSGGFKSIPRYWTQVGTWLQNHQGHENALMVPGSSFASYAWGYPGDEPLQVSGNASVEWRNLIPLGSNGYIQTLDAVETVLDNGTTAPGLAQFLSRGGIRYIIERNDLDWRTTGAPPPAQVHQVLSETLGLRHVASFGPRLPASQVEISSLPVYDSPSDSRLHTVEIFEVNHPTSIVQTYPVADPVVVSGDSGSLLPLSGVGVLTGKASALSGDSLAPRVSLARNATWAITDGNQHRDTGFGGIRNNTSYLLNAGKQLSSTPFGVPAGFQVVTGTKHQTVELPVGAASTSASSYGSTVLLRNSNEGPASAFDDDPATAWVADSTNRSVGQWVAITFRKPVSLSTIELSPLLGGSKQPRITRVTVSTDRGTVIRRVPMTDSPVRLSIPRGSSRYLRLTIDSVKGGVTRSTPGAIVQGAGITNIAIPGVKFEPRMKVPSDQSVLFSGPKRNEPVAVFSRPFVNSNLALGAVPTDDPDMARIFDLPKTMAAGVSGYAVASPYGPALEQTIEELTPQTPTAIQATASSWLGNLPRFRPQNLVDGSASPWIAEQGDKNPSVGLSWNRRSVVGAIFLRLSPQASRPTEISLTDSTGAANFSPGTQNRWTDLLQASRDQFTDNTVRTLCTESGLVAGLRS